MEHQFCPYCMSPVEGGKPCEACGLTQGSYTPSPHHLPPGTVLKERYLVGRVLGEGGFGITYIGCDLQLELKVAIKEYFPTDKASRVAQASLDVTSYTGAAGVNYDKGLMKFLQEARTIARMDKQPVIVNVRDFFEANQTAYIVMEYVEGTTFKDLVEQRGGRIPAGELLYLIEPLFFALKEMHGNGLIHRDISPENLMLEKGTVRLLDFGCARESADGGNTLTIALKHGYAPVEQYQSKGQGPWTDVYALSATLYYCLTGKKPPQAMDRLVEDELIPPRKLGVELTQRQEAALLHGMGVPPKRRFQSMEEFHTALYEGFVPNPNPVEERAAEVKPVPDVEDAAGNGEDAGDRTMEAAETAAEAKRPGFSLTAWLKQNKLLAGGIAAALALVVLLAAVLPRLLGPSHPVDPDPTQTVAGTPGPEETDNPAQTNPPVPADLTFRQDKRDEDNAAVLLALLADDSVDTVTIPANVNFTVDGSVTLTKLLQIKRGAGVTVHGGFTVAGGGSLEIAGDSHLTCDTLLRTMDGGTVSVAEGGQLYLCNIWLERKDDLDAAPGAYVSYWGGGSPDPQPHEMSHRLTLDEETLFADAVQVSSEEDFVQNLRGAKPMVIDGEVTLTQCRECYVPILVPEGSALNAPCEEGGADCTLDVHGTAIVNHGAIRGRVTLFGSWDDVNRIPVLVNHGRIEGCLNAYAGPATLINLGEIALSASLVGTPSMDSPNLANLGEVTLDCLVEMGNGWTANAGAVTVSGGGDLTLHNNANWQNYGQFTLRGDGALHNQSWLWLVSGRLTVGNGGELYNFGLLQVEGSGVLMGEAQSVLVNDGLVLEDGGLSVDASPFKGSGRILSPRYDSDRTRQVSSESELRAALADDRCDLVVWNGYDPDRKINLNGGPIQLTKGLVLRGDRDNPPEFNSGGLTLSGKDAFFIGDNVNFNSYELVVEGGTVLLDGDTRRPAENITVDGGLLFLAGGAEMPNPGTLDLRGGGRFLITGNIEFGQCGVTVEQDSDLWIYGYLGLSDCNVTNHGRIVADFGNLNQMDGGSLTNYGELHLTGWEEMSNLSDVTNHGEIVVAGQQRVSGTLVNEADGTIKLAWEDNTLRVSGRLDNRGTIRGARGTYIETVDGGTFTGNPVIYD